ncbi:uncharacterized protein [Typha angustifolia]|uniref:uncharacterized protein isoform X1 n=1 Tax=Typha angustifolia TaxID=59011 RepID=UPI003C2C42DB
MSLHEFWMINFHTTLLFICLVSIAITPSNCARALGTQGVQLTVEDHQVVIDNGILQLTISKPEGRVTTIRYNGLRNLLEYDPEGSNSGGYWDVAWNHPGNEQGCYFDRLDGTEFKVIVENPNQIEVSFSRTWNPSNPSNLQLNTETRFVVLKGSSGFYSYSIFEHPRGWPGIDLWQARIAFKLHPDHFKYMAISDNKQREMPSAADRESPRAEELAFKEAVHIINPVEPEFRGEVDDKYQYSMENKDSHVHGWFCSNPSTGFWVITPSDEFRSGGPVKQDLTSHVGPISLAMFLGDHYIGNEMHIRLKDGEYWKKVYGPVFIYLNSAAVERDAWQDAKAQMQTEQKNWPYSFPAYEGFPKTNQRGSVNGRLLVRDRYISSKDMPANLAYIGLALPGELGSWQTEGKGYQFWTRTDTEGYFTIDNIRAGNYNLYAWVPGIYGGYMRNSSITITPGSSIKFDDLIFEPPRAGPTLWEIGIPDRTAAEFFVPDPMPEYVNKLYVKQEKYRQYGLWARYADLYPTEDLVYRVNVSDYRKDWFFAHVTRLVGNNYQPTTWQIKFNLNSIKTNGLYTLRLGIAAAHFSRIQVRVNDPDGAIQFTTPESGDSNAIARHGIHGFQWNFDVEIEGRLLVAGENTIYLAQSRGGDKFVGIMYDYIRLEGPSYAN